MRTSSQWSTSAQAQSVRWRISAFRATQAEEKLKRDQVHGKQRANQTHFEVGQKVRETIKDLGGTMPEALPTPKAGIQQIESIRQKQDKAT